jgi:putative transposase
MPRRARIAVAGIPWHIIQRGNNRSPCFHADRDRHYYLNNLQQQAAKFGCAIHAYVLMTNHVHLLVTPQKIDSASLTMKHLGQRYVQYFNRSYKRSGTLWEGRFKSCLIESSTYLLFCYRYIELNPVRAKMVLRPHEYRWSSFGTNALGKASSLITPHEEYLDLGSSESGRRDSYRSMFGEELSSRNLDGIRRATNGNFVLGNPAFAKGIQNELGRRVIPHKAGRPKLGTDHD